MLLKRCFGVPGFSIGTYLGFVVCLLLLTPAQSRAQEGQVNRDILTSKLEQHAANKQKVLAALEQSTRLAVTQWFAMDYRKIRRSVIIDGEYGGTSKRAFLERAVQKCREQNSRFAEALGALLKSHEDLFGSGENKDLMIRSADDPALAPFGLSMGLPEAMARITEGNGAEVQAFPTIFETGQNTRGYVHKLECHAEVVEFVYAVTDIIYGVMLPRDLRFEPEGVMADPMKVKLFYARAGDVIALHPYVLHSGSLSVEPDKSFSVIIYKKPVVDEKELVVKLPDSWAGRRESLKIANVEKYYLTLSELHTADLETNCGYITDKKPLRLPVWP